MIKSIVGILFLTVWTFQCFFPYLFYHLGRIESRENFLESKDDIPAEEIQTFTFDGNQKIHWEIQDREFKLNGKLYDVISLHRENDTTVIRCVPDEDEDGIIDAFIEFLKENQKHNKNDKAKKIQCFTEKVPQFYFKSNLIKSISSKPKIKLLSVFPEVPYPPPENHLL